jgi:hypothetical protein
MITRDGKTKFNEKIVEKVTKLILLGTSMKSGGVDLSQVK